MLIIKNLPLLKTNKYEQFFCHRGFFDNGPQHNKYIAPKKGDSI